MTIDFALDWVPTHRIRIADPDQTDDTVMLWADEMGSGPAYTQEEWLYAREDPSHPYLWSCIEGQWLALGAPAEEVDGKPEFWGEPL